MKSQTMKIPLSVVAKTMAIVSPSGSSAKAAPDNRGASQLVRSGSFVSWLPSVRLSYAPGVIMVGICGHSDENIMAIYIQPLPCVAIVLEWRVTKPANQ